MANEHTKRYAENAAGDTLFDYDIADGTAISKGALLKLTDSGTAIISSAAADMIAGVAARDKIASDGTTRLAVYKKGRFTGTASGAITTGFPLISAADSNYPNTIKHADAANSGAAIIGYAEGDATDGEVVPYRLNL